MSEFHTKAPQATANENLPKVPTWRPERDSSPRPFGRKAMNLPMSHCAPQFSCHQVNVFLLFVQVTPFRQSSFKTLEAMVLPVLGQSPPGQSPLDNHPWTITSQTITPQQLHQ